MSDIATLRQKNNISIITMDDGKANAFSTQMLTELNNCLKKVPTDSGSLIITGREGVFSGGFDLKTLSSGDLDAIKDMVTLGYRALLDLYSFPRPIIAAVSGHAVALGLFVVCCADYRVGLEGKFICQANEVRNNMDIPPQIMEILKDRVSKRFFHRAILNGDIFSTQESIEVGYLDEVVQPEKLMERSLEKATDLATLGHPFYTNTKNTSQKEVVTKIKDALGI
tara:strand:+ start:5564 stop:6238 length:675 start_codon:yes stop_codon:yes gene_type:complete